MPSGAAKPSHMSACSRKSRLALRRSLAPRLVRAGLGAHEAEDLVQEILIGLHGKRHTWDSARPFLPWLHAIARYKLIDFTRQRRRETLRRVDLPLEDWLEIVESPPDEANRSTCEVDRHLAVLPVSQREIVRAIAVEGASVRNVALGLATSEGVDPDDHSPRDQAASGRRRAPRRSNRLRGTSMTSTDDLIRSLASTAGARRSVSLRVAFAVAGAASLACALFLVFSVIGIRHDFADMAVRMPFGFKLAYTGSLVVGTFVVALYVATPAASATALYALLPSDHFAGSRSSIRSNRFSDHGKNQHRRCLLRRLHSFSFAASHDPDVRRHAERRADTASRRGSRHWECFPHLSARSPIRSPARMTARRSSRSGTQRLAPSWR